MQDFQKLKCLRKVNASTYKNGSKLKSKKIKIVQKPKFFEVQAISFGLGGSRDKKTLIFFNMIILSFNKCRGEIQDITQDALFGIEDRLFA